MRPCRFSHALRCATVRRKSASARGFPTAIDDAGRRDEVFDRQGIGRIVRQVAAGDPVNGSVEMGAGMLAEAHIVPVPSRSAVVVARDLLHAKRPALAHLRRQHDRREIRRQRLCQIDDVNAARGGDRAKERAQSVRPRLRRAFLHPILAWRLFARHRLLGGFHRRPRRLRVRALSDCRDAARPSPAPRHPDKHPRPSP